MSKYKISIMMFIVALAVSAMAASTASASWFVNDEKLLSGETAALATTANVDESYVLKFGGITIKCASKTLSSVAPELVAPNKLTASSLVFGECAASGEECSLEQTQIGTRPLTAELTEEGTLQDKTVLTPKTGTLFATIKLTGATCSETGKIAITGKAATTLPTGQSEKTLQEVDTNAPSGELKVGSASATLKGDASMKTGGASAGTNWLFGACGGGLTTPNNASAKPGEAVSFNIENANCFSSIEVDKGEVTPAGGPFEFTNGAECVNNKKYEPRGNTVCAITVTAKATAMMGAEAKFKVETKGGGEKREVNLKVL